MALQLPNSQYFHIPRTGGFWVRKAITAGGVPTNELAQVGERFYSGVQHHFKRGTILHIMPEDIAQHGHKRFTFVRHPVSWLVSYFWHRYNYGWNMQDTMDAKCNADDALTFLENYVKFAAGSYTDLVKLYDGVDFVGRTEYLEDDLVEILIKCGEQFDEDKLRAVEPYNVSDKAYVRISDGLRKQVEDAERYVIERYYSDGLV